MTDNPRRAGSPARIRKTSEICAQCRNRKVRCDGNPRGCSNCKRLRFECSFVAPSTGDTDSPELLERRRVRRACISCRNRKLKCSGRLPECSRCLERGLACRYPNSARVTRSDSHGLQTAPSSPRLQQAETSRQSQLLPEQAAAVAQSRHTALIHEWNHLLESDIGKQNIKQHIEAYFEFVYPQPCCGFFHRASLLKSWSQGALSPLVLQAICGLTSRFIHRNSPEHQELARKWIEETESRLLTRLAHPTVSDIEAWLLVTLDHCFARRFSRMLISISLTARLAYILRLNHEDDRQPFLVQEQRRRLMWSIFTMDTLYSSGKAEFTACTTETLHIQLPCNETSFSMDIPVSTEVLAPTSESHGESAIGLLGYCVRVLEIRDRVQRLTLTITNHRNPLEESLVAVQTLENELQRFQASLPSHYHFTTKTFSLHAFSPSRTPFIMLHAWWHQTHCDLFRFTIPGFREGLPASEISQLSDEFTAASREKCLSHALSVSQILETPKVVSGVDLISDPALAMCAFHSARIISRLGQFPLGNMPQAELVARLSACAEALEEQASVFPTTAILRKGVIDLVNDAQRQRNGVHAASSIWEEEENEENLRGWNEGGHGSTGVRGQSGRGEIYSKYSVTDVIRNLHFEAGDGDSNGREDSTSGDGPVMLADEAHSAHTPRERPPLQQQQPAQPQHQPQPPQEQQGIMPGLFEPDTRNFTGYAGDIAEYAQGFQALGFDPRYDTGQPDLFMDSFWPLICRDWTVPDGNGEI
ncbi:hypothetical protein BJY00DRAFT_106210 [Aspergillus carlsbadensis]|nr:hypothetical protein BJY00DRAFT_106210 [Aspergillus carlsbadensis]